MSIYYEDFLRKCALALTVTPPELSDAFFFDTAGAKKKDFAKKKRRFFKGCAPLTAPPFEKGGRKLSSRTQVKVNRDLKFFGPTFLRKKGRKCISLSYLSFKKGKKTLYNCKNL